MGLQRIILIPAHGEMGGGFSFYAIFTDSDEKYPTEKINQWNRSKSYSRSYWTPRFGQATIPVLELDP